MGLYYRLRCGFKERYLEGSEALAYNVRVERN